METQQKVSTRTFNGSSTQKEKTFPQIDYDCRELIEGLPAAIYTCDAEGRITFYNNAAAELWGRKPIIGKDLWCGSWKIYRTDGTLLPLDECPMAITLKEGRPAYGEEIVVERPDGMIVNVLPHPKLCQKHWRITRMMTKLYYFPPHLPLPLLILYQAPLVLIRHWSV